MTRDARAVEAWIGAARLLQMRGDPGQAAQLLSQAVRAVSADDRGRAAAALAPLLSMLRPSAWADRLDEDIRCLLGEPEVEAQSLARVAAQTLLLKHPHPLRDGGGVDEIARDPLWIAFLGRVLNVDAGMERRLTDLRSHLCARFGSGDIEPSADMLDLLAALALQAEAAEHVWVEDAGGQAIAANSPGPVGVLLRALFRPLILEDEAGLEALRRVDRPMIHLLIERAVVEPRVERDLGTALPSLDAGDTATAVSIAVRDQYEASPYPRWRDRPGRSGPPLSSIAAALTGSPRGSFRRVLVAGCGTGHEPIDIKLGDPALDVTAIDLSRASLGYALRQTRDFGADVNFMAGDILGLEPSQVGLFDLVTSTGVLHHLADPAEGLSRLAAVVRPGGLLRLALYSERARAPVVHARALIATEALASDPSDIRAFRARVLAARQGDPLALLADSDDLYSLSGCRDLLFHVQEHRFSAPELGALVSGAGLDWLRLDAGPAALDAFSRINGPEADRNDLMLWDRVEALHPDLFAGMFHFWCARPPTH